MPKGVYQRTYNPATNFPHRERVPWQDRFWAKVDKNGPVVDETIGPCWVWTAAIDGRGYGKLQLGTLAAPRLVSAHRLAWRLAEGVDPPRHILHHCDNKRCVRRSHLFDGGPADNMADKVAKSRQRRGVDISQSKLTEAQVAEVRDLYARGLINQSGAARSYGVSVTTINNVVHRKTWRHLG